MSPAVALELVATENGDIACGRYYVLDLQHYLVFSVYADYTKAFSQTHLTYAISPSFQLAFSYPYRMWSKSIGGSVNNDEIAVNLREMVREAHNHFHDFSPQRHVEKTKELFLETGKSFFELIFDAAVLAFLGQFDDPKDLLRLAKAVAVGSKTYGPQPEFAAKTSDQSVLADQALTALDNGPFAFRSFLTDQQAKCLPRFCQKKPKALSRLPRRKPFLLDWTSQRERLASEQHGGDLIPWDQRPPPMSAITALTLVARENGDLACGRNYIFGLQDHFVFGIYADRTSNPLQTRLTYCISPTFLLSFNEPYWLWAEPSGCPVSNDAIVASLREMAREPCSRFREFSPRDYVSKTRDRLNETGTGFFRPLFNAAVLAFLRGFDDPRYFLYTAKIAAEDARTDLAMRKSVTEIPGWIDLANKALAALDDGADAFRGFLNDREAECLPRFCPKKPNAALNIPKRRTFFRDWDAPP